MCRALICCQKNAHLAIFACALGQDTSMIKDWIPCAALMLFRRFHTRAPLDVGFGCCAGGNWTRAYPNRLCQEAIVSFDCVRLLAAQSTMTGEDSVAHVNPLGPQIRVEGFRLVATRSFPNLILFRESPSFFSNLFFCKGSTTISKIANSNDAKCLVQNIFVRITFFAGSVRCALFNFTIDSL